ncbi:zinc ribbon domain-containing protein [Priestia megaterium]|uniref:zinc ribbon domain-containing protein n=1 Tax=Priestia megaterium TaxID=1404 RepID=UPI002041A03E|nr:zinc ribbon domain-containing protein [Priestia megaterium]MCM3546848.1 zinc ribbon domain-containing protein [Priestia megaterium]
MDYIRGIALASGEEVIRQYEATYLENPKTEGYLVATNRRLIFCGEAKSMSGSSMIVKDVQIDHVTGIHAFMGAGKNFSKIILIIVLTILFLMLGKFASIFWAGLLIPGFIVYKLITNPFKSSVLSMVVMADSQTPSSINITASGSSGGFIASLFSKQGFDGSHAMLSVAAAPGNDTVVMIKELGALVLDIQAQGEHAKEKWLKLNASDKKQTRQHKAPALKCLNCNATYEENEKFCGKCGTSLQTQSQTAADIDTQNFKEEDFFSR